MQIDAWAVQVAAYDLLVAADLPASPEIVDTLPGDDATYPYVLIGESQGVPDDVEGSSGVEIYRDFHVYSQAPNQREVTRLLTAITQALHEQSLAVAGLTTCFGYFDASRIFNDPDGVTRHGVLTLKFICHA